MIRATNMSHWIMFVATRCREHRVVRDGIDNNAPTQNVLDAPGAKTLEVERGEIRFEQVNFHYDAEKKTSPTVEDLTLTLQPGEKVGLVGRSGAGKSTLVNLLLRFHDVQSGRILIDGQDTARVEQESLRAQIGLVTQDTSLLHRSILDNIRYGRPEATLEQSVAAAKRAQAHDFILELDDGQGRTGYEAHVGERGVKLSGGQRQRIAIARVLLKDAPILVLDEATSALDSEVEAAIQGSFSIYGRQDGNYHRSPSVDHRGDGPACDPGGRTDHRDRHASGIVGPGWPLRGPVVTPIGWLHRNGQSLSERVDQGIGTSLRGSCL